MVQAQKMYSCASVGNSRAGSSHLSSHKGHCNLALNGEPQSERARVVGGQVVEFVMVGLLSDASGMDVQACRVMVDHRDGAAPVRSPRLPRGSGSS